MEIYNSGLYTARFDKNKHTIHIILFYLRNFHALSINSALDYILTDGEVNMLK